MTSEHDAEEMRTLRLLIDASNDGFWDWNIVTGSVRFGGRWGEMLGYPPETLEPHVRTWERLVHPDDRPWVMATLQTHLDGGTDHYQAEHRMLARNGDWRWILDRGRVVERDAHGRPLRACGAHVDVTERKSLDLEKERIAAEREELLGMVSHELKNPMQAITNAAETIERTTGTPLAERTVPMAVTHLHRALGRMQRLVADLLEATRLEAGAKALMPRRIVWSTVLDAALPGVAPMLEQRRIDIIKEGPMDDEIVADPERLAQVVANLLENAAKFSPEGGVVRLVAGRPDAATRSLRVCDQGPGIPPEHRELAFARFWQGKTSAYKGVGLGLYIARRIARASGGELRVIESASPGAVLELSIPIAPAID